MSENQDAVFQAYRQHMDENFARVTQHLVDQGVKVDKLSQAIHTMEILISTTQATAHGSNEQVSYRVEKLEQWQGAINKQLLAIVVSVIMIVGGFIIQQWMVNATRGADAQPQPSASGRRSP